MRFPHKFRRYRPHTLLVFGVLVSLCFSFNARLDAAAYAHEQTGLAESLSVGVGLVASPSQALTNPATAWAQIPSQAKTRVKRPSVYPDALVSGRVSPRPAIRRFSQVQILSDLYSSVFNSRPRGRAPPHIT
jgi:hypothetical protein